MLKTLLIFVMLLSVINVFLMMEGFILAIKSGGKNVLLPSLRLVVAPIGYSVMLLVIEIILITVAILLYQA